MHRRLADAQPALVSLIYRHHGSRHMAKRTTVRLPEDLLNRTRRKAFAENRTLTSLIEDGLRVVLGEHGEAKKRGASLPRVSKARGGLMPGVNLTRPSLLQEAEDLDDIRRVQRSQ